MSRYMLDKIMWEIDRSEDALAAFRDDPEGFVSTWEASAESAEPPYPLGGRLDDGERAAIVSHDWGALYALGAHPYLLWHLARAVSILDGMSVAELDVMFVAAVRPHGHPDFAT